MIKGKAALAAIPSAVEISLRPHNGHAKQIGTTSHNTTHNQAVVHESAHHHAQVPKRTANPRARRNRLVLQYLPLAKSIATGVNRSIPVYLDLDDLIHAGILGLFEAADKFDPDKQVEFGTYARHRIKGAILDSLRELDWASRVMRRRYKQMEAAANDLSTTLQRKPTEAELAEKFGVDIDRWRAMMLDPGIAGLVSASSLSNENEDQTASFPGRPEAQPDSICARAQIREVLEEAKKTLPERHQQVVALYYENEMTMTEIGQKIGVNASRVSQIHKVALKKMMIRLRAKGIQSGY